MKLIPNLSEIDRKTVLQTGISAETLMENAGTQVALAVQNFTQKSQTGVLVCGPGNNGGDGFVCARKLYEAGYQFLTLIYTGSNYKNESLANLEKILIGLPIQILQVPKQLDMALFRLRDADFIVDALFGSGLSRNISGDEARLIEAVNQRKQAAHCPVIAVDIPSGVNSDHGGVLDIAVQASQTVTFATGKPGLYLYPGKGHAGEVSVVDIGIPAALIEEDESPVRLLTDRQAADWLPKRQPDSHKYNYGHVLVIAGSHTMPGAAVLASESAMSCGAGLVTLAAPESVFNQLPIIPEIMRLPLPDRDCLAHGSVKALQSAFKQKKFSTVLLGPGLGREPETISTLHTLFQWLLTLNLPVIVDADGLYALAQSPLSLSEQFILTPHVGECARLLDIDSASVSANLPQAAKQARQRYEASIVLKSASTVIATTGPQPEAARLWISPVGNAGMATAGSGDVLGGIISALAAQRQAQEQPVWPAAPLGVYLHGLTGDYAAKTLTPYAMRASDITRHLPQAFHHLLAD